MTTVVLAPLRSPGLLAKEAASLSTIRVALQHGRLLYGK
jgi:hypothetical protein